MRRGTSPASRRNDSGITHPKNYTAPTRTPNTRPHQTLFKNSIMPLERLGDAKDERNIFGNAQIAAALCVRVLHLTCFELTRLYKNNHKNNPRVFPCFIVTNVILLTQLITSLVQKSWQNLTAIRSSVGFRHRQALQHNK